MCYIIHTVVSTGMLLR